MIPLLFLATTLQGMQPSRLSKLPQEVQGEIFAHDFINQLSMAHIPNQENTFSNILGFLKLYPQFAKNQDFINRVLYLVYKNFPEEDLMRLANLLKDNGIQPATQWLLNYHLLKKIEYGSEKEVEKLLAEGAQATTRILGNSPMTGATTRIKRFGSFFNKKPGIEIMQSLLAHGANAYETSEYDQTPLMIAAKIPNNEAVTLLLKYKANLSLKDNLERTALHYAIYSAQEAENLFPHELPRLADEINKVIATITTAGADINSRDYKERTPLALAYDELKDEKNKYFKPQLTTVLEPVIAFIKSKGGTE
jgi:hypothetical protein